ncbi:MAG: 1-acyl-sn-glycerol-3-phosphate acyltransferase [Oligoflexia bacterium]|nr:1-acyl-sn-glycerol-3-phosphate acyltransferase [Oligoflexia bacterium]
MILLGTLKLISFFVAVMMFFITMTPLYLVYKLNPYQMRPVLAKGLQLYCKLGLVIFNVKIINQRELDNLKESSPAFYVSNHLSYLDVVIYGSLKPFCFVTSQEMREVPFLGQLCEVAACAFVERRSKKNLSSEVRDLTETMKNKGNIFVFPEGTSTNGEEVIRFRRPLFRSAIDAGVKVRPFTLNYLRFDDKVINKGNRDIVCWYDDMTFLDHLIKLLRVRSIKVEIIPHSSISTKNTDITELSERAQYLVSKDYRSFSDRKLVSDVSRLSESVLT